jgi:hypothetical protein
MGTFNDEKIQFCTQEISNIEKHLKKQILSQKIPGDIEIRSFIISVTDYDMVRSRFEDNEKTREDFENHNIIFQEGDYIPRIFDKIL